MQHKVVSRDEWIAARKAHLANEKAFTKARDQLSAEPAADARSTRAPSSTTSMPVAALRAWRVTARGARGIDAER